MTSFDILSIVLPITVTASLLGFFVGLILAVFRK